MVQSTDPQEKTFLALGDSYTIGEAVPVHERWPVQLAAMLREAGVHLADPVIIARTGWTTEELAQALLATPLSGPFDLVSLLIGVNDQYRGYPPEPYRESFSGLLDSAIRLAGGDPEHVFVLSIPDWGMTPFAAAEGRRPEKIAAEVLAFNALNAAVSQIKNVWYVDVFPISQEARAEPDLIASDGLHPSGHQYRRWAQAALPVARQILG